MAPKKLQSSVWALAREQHGVVTRAQLIGLGYGSEAIRHRLRGGRLHPVRRGVYAIGRPELSRLGVWNGGGAQLRAASPPEPRERGSSMGHSP